MNRLLDQIKALSSEDQLSVREVLDGLLSTRQGPPTEDEFEQELVELGVLTQPAQPALTPPARSGPIEIKGKPLSEIIVEERR